AALDDDLVESQKRARLAVGTYLALEHEVAGSAIVAGDDVRDGGADLIGRDVSEEAELAEVDAQDGDLLATHLSRRPQDCPVAAQHQRDLRRMGREVFALLQVEDHDFALLAPEGPSLLGLAA